MRRHTADPTAAPWAGTGTTTTSRSRRRAWRNGWPPLAWYAAPHTPAPLQGQHRSPLAGKIKVFSPLLSRAGPVHGGVRGGGRGGGAAAQPLQLRDQAARPRRGPQAATRKPRLPERGLLSPLTLRPRAHPLSHSRPPRCVCSRQLLALNELTPIEGVTPVAERAPVAPAPKYNSTSSLYIDSTITRPCIDEIIFCVSIVIHDRVEEGKRQRHSLRSSRRVTIPLALRAAPVSLLSLPRQASVSFRRIQR